MFQKIVNRATDPSFVVATMVVVLLTMALVNRDVFGIGRLVNGSAQSA